MKAQPTPGPWKARGTCVYFPNVKGGFDIRNCPDAEANARLIAAAPELLDALQLCIGELNHIYEITQTQACGHIINKARKIISKARGE